MPQGDAEGHAFAFEGDPAVAAVGGGEDRPVIGEDSLLPAVAGEGGGEVGDDGAGGEDLPGGGADQQPGVVVDDIEDLGVGVAGQWPVGDVGLPAFVGLIGFEPSPGRPGTLLRLRGDKAAARQHPPDRRDRRGRLAAVAQVPADRLGARVQALFAEFLTKADDQLLALVGHHPPGGGMWPAGPGLEGTLTLGEEPADQRPDPQPGKPVVAGDLAL